MPSRTLIAAVLLGLALLGSLALLWPAPPELPVGYGPGQRTEDKAAPGKAASAPVERLAAEDRQKVESGETPSAVLAQETRTEDRADPPLTIVVHDPAGAAVAGVPLALVGSRNARAWQGESAVDGLAQVSHPRQRVQQLADPVAVVVLSPLSPPPSVAIDRAAFPDRPVELVLPPTGRVMVWIDDLPTDQTEAVTVTLSAERNAATEGAPAFAAAAHPRQGAATFPFVGLGLPLVVYAQRAGQSESARAAVTGPVAAGEVVHVHMRVQPADDRVVMVMHLQDRDGAPLRKQQIGVSLELRGRGSTSASDFGLDTDAEGILRLVADENFQTLPERSLRLRTRKEQAGETTEALVNVSGALRPGENDLGIVAMLPPPLVCSGTVVDHAGRAVAPAELRVSWRPATASNSRELREVRGLEGTSDATGRFALRGGTPQGDLFLTASAAGFLARENVPFLPGADGLRIELDAAAVLTGSVQLDEVVTPADVIVDLDAAGGHRTARVHPAGRLGAFRFESIPPGPATVAVRLLGEPDGLLVSDLQLMPGEVNRDARLQEVDLSKGRRAVHFTVVEADGTPGKDARVVVLNGTGQRTFEGYLLSSSSGRIVTQRSPLEVLIWAAGRRSLRVADLLDGSRVTLPPPLRVRVQLPAGCPAPASPFSLEVRLDARTTGWPEETVYRLFESNHEYSGDGSPPWLQSRRAVCGPDGSAVLQVPEPGTWGLAFRLSRHQGDDRVDRWLANDPPAITVSDVAGEQLVTASLRAEQLLAAQARLEAR